MICQQFFDVLIVLETNKYCFTGDHEEELCTSCSHCNPMGNDNLFISALEYDFSTEDIDLSPTLENYREISLECKKEFKEELLVMVRRRLQKEFKYAPIIGRPILSTEDIEEILNRLHGITSHEQLQDLVIDESVRQEILALVYDFFRDIPDDQFELALTEYDEDQSVVSNKELSVCFTDDDCSSEEDGEIELLDYISDCVVFDE